MVLKAKFDVEIEEHLDNEEFKDVIEKIKETDEETIAEKLKKGMEDTLTYGRPDEKINVIVTYWDTDFDV